jgi:Kef-type K+ transport system membrane component KefB
MVDTFFETLTHLPTLTRFAIALAVFLFVPKLCERIRLPAAVGLLAAGVLLGPSGLAVAPKSPPVTAFFSEIGKLLLNIVIVLMVVTSVLGPVLTERFGQRLAKRELIPAIAAG